MCLQLAWRSENGNDRRRRENDATAALNHVRHYSARSEKDDFEVDVDDGIPKLLGHHRFQPSTIPLHQLSIANDARIVNQYIDSFPFLYNRLSRQFDLSAVGDV